MKKFFRKGSGEMLGLTYVTVFIVILFIFMCTLFQLSFGLYDVNKMLMSSSRAAAVCTSMEDAQKQAELVAESTSTHIAVTKESTVTETGEESIICSECGTVLEKRIVPRKQSPKGNANQTTSDTASKEGNISEGKQNETEDAALENNMISVPQIGLKSVFTQGPFTQNAVDANDILLAYAYAIGLGENDPFILGHNTYSLKNLRNIQVGTNIYLNFNGILETFIRMENCMLPMQTSMMKDRPSTFQRSEQQQKIIKPKKIFLMLKKKLQS